PVPLRAAVALRPVAPFPAVPLRVAVAVAVPPLRVPLPPRFPPVTAAPFPPRLWLPFLAAAV
ncbi:MAG: hypothetical protein WAK82_05140, partial [Streptosporangiaceae bacterium]